MTKEQDTGLFGVKLPKGKELEEATKRLLEGRPKEKRILKRRFNLNKVYGPGTYADVGEQIEQDGLSRPTMAEMASLVYGAFNSINKHSKKIKEIMEGGYLWTFTGTLYIPKKGVYIQDDPKIVDEHVFMDESDLVKKLQKNDKSVRFVPFGYKRQEMTPKELIKNQFVIGLVGKEGAEKLADIAGEYKYNPYLWSFKPIKEPLTSFSAMYSNVHLSGWRLGVGDRYSDNDIGCCFGIQKNARGEK